MKKPPPAPPPPTPKVAGCCANCGNDVTDSEAVWRVGAKVYCTTRTCHDRFVAEGNGFYDILGLAFEDEVLNG